MAVALPGPEKTIKEYVKIQTDALMDRLTNFDHPQKLLQLRGILRCDSTVGCRIYLHTQMYCAWMTHHHICLLYTSDAADE